MRLRLRYRVNEPVSEPNFIVSVLRSDGVACCNYSTAADGVDVAPEPGAGCLELLTPPLSLVAELYRFEILVREQGLGRLVCAQMGGGFHVRHPVYDMHFGVFHEAAVWGFRNDSHPAASKPLALETEP